MDLTISIVNWNTCDLLGDCIRSILKETKEIEYEIIVVDNNSSDGSQEMARGEFPMVQLIENRENRGFGAANNQALRLGTGEFAMLLNSDTEIMDGALDRCVGFLREHPDVGAVSPRMWLDREKIFQCPSLPMYNLFVTLAFTTPFGRYFPSVRRCWTDNWNVWLGKEPVEVGGIVGAGFILRTSLLERFDYMDEKMFMYFEDQDLSMKVGKAGYRCVVVIGADMIHYFNKSGKSNPRQDEIFRKSMIYFFRKNWGLTGLLFFKAGQKILHRANRLYPFLERRLFRTKRGPDLTVSFEKPVLELPADVEDMPCLLEIAIDSSFIGTVGALIDRPSASLSSIASSESIDRVYFYRYAPIGSARWPREFTYGTFRVTR